MEKINVSISGLKNAERFKEILKEKQWSMEKGTEILLAYGIAYADAKKRLEGSPDKDKVFDEIIREHIENEASYAALRFSNFQISKDNRLVNFRLLGYSFDNEQLRATLKSLEEEDKNE